MFELWIKLDRATVDTLKVDLSHRLRNVKSSHRCEALARGLGFKSYAALRAVTQDQGVVAPRRVDGYAFASYLAEHGFKSGSRSFYEASGKVALAAVLEISRNLTSDGLGLGEREWNGNRWESLAERSARFASRRASFEQHPPVGEFLRALALLSRIDKTKHPTGRNNSYELKYIAEELPSIDPEGQPLGPGYVSNGAFIAAALHSGFVFEICRGAGDQLSLNVTFNMSQRSLRLLRAQRDLTRRTGATGCFSAGSNQSIPAPGP